MEDRKEIINLINQNMENYLSSKGLNPYKNFSCLNPEHTDGDPSMKFYNDTNKVKCFGSCGKTFDLLDLIGIDYNTDDFNKKIEIGCSLFNIPLPDGKKITKKYNKPPKANNNNKPSEAREKPQRDLKDLSNKIDLYHSKVGDTSYFRDRGLSEEVIKYFWLGYCDDFRFGTGGKSWKTAIIPLSHYMYNARNIDKNASKQERYRKEGTGFFFGHKLLRESEQTIFVTEGEIDALSVSSVLFIDNKPLCKAIATGGVDGCKLVEEEIKKQGTVNTYIILFDNDEAGQSKAVKFKEALEKLGQTAFNINICKDTKYKDVNEFLIGDHDDFVTEILELNTDPIEYIRLKRLKEYKKNNAKNYIPEFLKNISDSVNTPYTPTGFKGLDELLGGGLYEGLYFIGAISSLGKTTLTLQMADNIAKQGKDVLIISLEMARSELMAKSISRLTFINAYNNKKDINKYAKSLRGITDFSKRAYYNEEEISIINQSIKEYSKISEHLYIHEGIGNIGVKEIKETVKLHTELTGKAPVIIIDYIQILAPYDFKMTDKQNTDKAVLELKRLSRDYKATVIGISSFNRQNYNTTVGMGSFKESGAIEYGSDVLIGLQYAKLEDDDFDINEEVKKAPRDIELRILKNRNGKSHVKTYFKFYSKYNYFYNC